MVIRDFRDLDVWQEAVDLAVAVYQLTRRYPADERFGLTQQLRTASVSVSSNIAEGNGRGSTKDYARFVMNSKGSSNEVLSLLTVSKRLEIVTAADFKMIEEQADRIGRMLMGLRSSLLKGSRR
jgi:four helix bundle protein